MRFLQALVLCIVALGAAAAPRSELRGLANLRVRRDTNTNGTTISASDDERIVGGAPVPAGKLPFLCALKFLGQQFCGCSIIAPNFALTAAHCTDAVGGPTGLVVLAGTHNVALGLTFAVDRINQNENYNRVTLGYDVSVVHTRSPITGPNIATIPIAAVNLQVPDGQRLITAGFGTLFTGGPPSPVLLQTSVFKVPQAQCQANYAPGIQITSTMLCASAPGADSCQGDSGGPLLQPSDPLDNSNVLVGIVSFGLACADPLHPGVYTNIADPDINTFITTSLVAP